MAERMIHGELRNATTASFGVGAFMNFPCMKLFEVVEDDETRYVK
ncbi:MAG: hypothetical protein NVS4B11_32200 [Ktedonobacteraceae bacterium]